MAGTVRTLGRVEISANELDRQFRLSRQTLAMHHSLCGSYRRRAVVTESVLLLASVGFCATTFAGDDLYISLRLNAESARLSLGLLSVMAFSASILLLTLDWKGAAARHGDAAMRWSSVVALFRQRQRDDSSWPEECAPELHHAYWEAAHNSVDIPDRQFQRLKWRYLMKVEISRRLDLHPGAPRLLLWLQVRCRDTVAVLRGRTNRRDRS